MAAKQLRRPACIRPTPIHSNLYHRADVCVGLQLDLIAAEELLRLEEGGGGGGDAAGALENPLDALRQARGPCTHLC